MKKHYTSLKNQLTLKLSILFVLFGFFVSSAQVTTNSGSGLAATYPDLASAITALNGAIISSPVVITLTGNETAPAGGFLITAQGDASNTIVIQGGGFTVTAPTPQVSGLLNDAIFKLIGADWVTIEGFIMLENPANTTTTAASNNMTEWGVALLYATTSNGALNNTIQNNTIDLNRTYQNTFGIYSNATHTATAPTTSATAVAGGGNSGLKVYANNITDVNIGILVVGPTAAADHNDGIDIGGASLATGNTITNYGTTGTFSGYANVSGSVNGILVRNSKNFNVSFNSISSSNGGVTAGTLRGIFIPSFNNAPTGTIVNTINNNIVSLRTGFAGGAMVGIINEVTTVSTTTTLSINNNDFNNFGHTVSGTAAITLISNAAATQITNINSNTFTNLSVNTTGSFTFITNSVTHAANSITNVNNNSVVTAFAKTGAGGTVYFYDAFGSTIGGSETNTGNNFSNITLTGATTLGGFRTADGATPYPLKTVTNNVFNNIVNGAGAMTILNVGYSAIGSTNNVSGNTISNISGGAGIIGITSAAGDQAFFNNTINGLNTTGASVVSGFSITGGTTQSLYKNKIFDIQSNNASGSVNGILVSSGTTTNIYNNIIGDLRTPIANAANPLNGINITGGTTVNAYYNTVLLNGSSSGALFGSSAFSASTTPTLTLRNNILVNNSTVAGAGLAAAYRRSSTTLTSYATASNNNLFFGSTIFTDGTNTDATLVAFKARMATRDAVSVSENPNFISVIGSNANFLHIDPAVATQIESGGTTIAGITDDFDGNVRNVSTPDIGADEFAGIVADITGSTIVHTAPTGSCTEGSMVISATITDLSGVPTSGLGLPVAYWRINAGPYTAATGTSIGAGVYEFSIASGSIYGDVISYYLAAQDNATIPNVSTLPATGASGFSSNPPAATTSPTSNFSYSILPALNGVYTVGATGNYPTLTAAVLDYNTRCIGGPVTFDLIDATYSSETFPIVVQPNVAASSINTLTIKPATGVSAIISGSSATSIIKLNGADYVTINGSNNATSSRDLSIENTNAAGVVVWVGSENASNGALFNTIRNVNFTGGSSTSTIAGIIVSGTALGGAAEASNSNLVIEGNSFARLQNGIFAIGNATIPDTNWTISRNIFGSTVAASKLGFRGIAVQNAQNFIISENTISGVSTSSTSTSSGILVGANASNGLVYNNMISDIKNTNTGGYGSNGIYLNSTSTSANILVYNNMIFNVASYGYASGAGISDNGYGIIVTAGAGYSIYHNTVLLNTNQTVSGLPAAFNVTSGVTLAGAINLRNNIFVNSQTQAGQRYSIYSGAANTVFSEIDFNDYFSSGANLGFIGSARATLADIQTGFGQNVSSINILPVFVSASDLHLDVNLNPTLDNKGTSIAAVTLDIDGNVRSTTTPDVGADEFCAVTTNVTDVTACGTYTWSVNGTTYTTSGTYTNTVGCNTETLNLTITPITTNVTDVTACGTYTWSVNGTTYTTSGTYTNTVDCHTETLNLTITPITTNVTDVTACGTYTWSVNGTTYTTSGTYTNTVDCHTETLNLTITPITTNVTDATACGTYTWSVNGTTYTTSGTYTNTVDCHTETLNLTITPITTNVTDATACGTYTWLVNGTTYTTSGTYTNTVGCHTETLNLTINALPSNATTQTGDTLTASETGATYQWVTCDGGGVFTPIGGANAQSYLVTAIGSYAVIVTGANGCPVTSACVDVTSLSGNTFDLTKLTYYPNPVVDIFTVKYDKEIESINVFDLSGRLVRQLSPRQLEAQVDMSELATAMYIVKVNAGGKQTEIKVMKK